MHGKEHNGSKEFKEEMGKYTMKQMTTKSAAGIQRLSQIITKLLPLRL